MKIKHKKLKEWTDAGLISIAQGDAIHAYEQGRRRGHFGRGLIGLSLFAILIGILSIIAANWYAIPGEVKIGVHVLLNLGIGALAFWADKNEKALWREGAVLAFLGLTFTLIILVGQVYQLDGSAADATIFWFLITLPFFVLLGGRGYMSSVAWTAGLLPTIGFVVFDKLDVPDAWLRLITFGLITLLPLAFMAKGASAHFQRWREALADVFLKGGIFFAAVNATVLLTMWQYANKTYRENMLSLSDIIIVGTLGFGGLALHALYHKFYRDNELLKNGAMFAAVSFGAVLLPVTFPAFGSEILSAISFIGYWIFIGWLAQTMGRMRIVSLAVSLIAIRIFWVYVELFGSLIDTGFGLIIGGLVMLSLIYAARRANTYFTKGTGDNATI